VHPQRTFYTGPLDCVIWTGKLLFTVVAVAAAVAWVVATMRGNPAADAIGLGFNILAFVFGASVVGGLLLFFFGWLGRVTISAEGVKGPRYSGLHQFVPWSDVKDVESGSLNGWPCAVVYSRRARSPTYVMVIGRGQTRLVECIRELAPADNPLRTFYCGHDA
jgi:hypothetical protein